jgi:hypothetical protein
MTPPIKPRFEDPIPLGLDAIRKEIDYWVNRLHEGAPGSEFRENIESRLRELRYYEGRAKEESPVKSSSPEASAGAEPRIDIFISHSGADTALAKGLIDLLLVALPLEPKRIRCTSVNGYRLEAGAETDDQLRTEIWGAEVFIGLLTEQSIGSTYVLFELGARWGAKMQLKPLLAAGKTPDTLKAPLSSLNALSCGSEEQLIQLIHEIGERLGMTPRRVDAYLSNLKTLAGLSQSLAKKNPREQIATAPVAAPVPEHQTRSALELVIEPRFVKYCQPGLAEFQITAKLWNRSSSVIKEYHLDIQMPAKLLDGDTALHWHELPERRTATHRFFRFPARDARVGPIYPDDQTAVGSLTFYADATRFSDAELLNSQYQATAYAGSERVVLSKSVAEIFKQAKVDEIFRR